MDSLFNVVFWLMIAGFLGAFAYRFLKYKGFKGAMFGGEIVHTIGEVEGKRQFGGRPVLKVHVLRSPESADAEVGLEFVAKTFASYQMMPITLARAEASKLASLLAEAARR